MRHVPGSMHAADGILSVEVHGLDGRLPVLLRRRWQHTCAAAEQPTPSACTEPGRRQSHILMALPAPATAAVLGCSGCTAVQYNAWLVFRLVTSALASTSHDRACDARL